jgi:2-oxoisovalerate dehydrogenase E2 component (dihydrolipoyl transacylase)
VADLKQFLLPDVGEGLTEAEIIKWDVKPGDTVVVNQTLVEIETAKAAVELPSPFAGVVTALHAAAGDTVDVGRPIITIDTEKPGAVATKGQPVSSGTSATPPPALSSGNAAAIAEGRQPVLVGYGPKADGPSRRRQRIAADAAPDGPVLAKPPVRLLAKNLGVDLGTVTPTGPNGSVSRADIEQAAAGPDGADQPSGSRRGSPGQRETRVPVRAVRKQMAAAMVSSAFTAPHASLFHTVDVSAMMELRERIAGRPEFREIKVSPLLLLAKALMIATAQTPEMNATWDEAAGEVVLKHYVNLGIAVATPRGLLVPNVKDADQLSLRELALALRELTEAARAGRTTPAELSHGTITITNVGTFGIDTGTPILNPGESGIVAFGAVTRKPWVVDEQVVPRWVTTLSISFDHRVVDGQQGARFLSTLAGVLADPGLALL